VPQNSFEKQLLVDMIQKKYSKYNPFNSIYKSRSKIIITVSPVRHIKDGFVENQLASPI
jgi:hypothetical protein